MWESCAPADNQLTPMSTGLMSSKVTERDRKGHIEVRKGDTGVRPQKITSTEISSARTDGNKTKSMLVSNPDTIRTELPCFMRQSANETDWKPIPDQKLTVWTLEKFRDTKFGGVLIFGEICDIGNSTSVVILLIIYTRLEYILIGRAGTSN